MTIVDFGALLGRRLMSTTVLKEQKDSLYFNYQSSQLRKADQLSMDGQIKSEVMKLLVFSVNDLHMYLARGYQKMLKLCKMPS